MSLNDQPGPIALPPLKTERLVLRALREADLDAFVHFQTVSREHLRPWSARPPEGQTLEDRFREQVALAERSRREGTALRLAGFDAETGRIAGMFGLNNIVRRVFQSADAGWQVSAEFVGRGYATEGVRALLDLAFAAPARGLGLHRVQANVIPENAPSLRVAAKCGFRVEGRGLRMLMIDGAWRDHVMHAILADEHGFRYLR